MAEDATGIWEELSGPNAAYLLDAYERYQTDPESVSPDLRDFFQRGGPPPEAVLNGNGAHAPAPAARPLAAPGMRDGAALSAGAASLAAAIRGHGHRGAQ